MKALYKIIPASFLATVLLFTACDKQKENVGPSAVSQSQDGKSQPNGDYSVSYVGKVYAPVVGSTGYTTFTYRVTPTSSSRDISHFILTLPCKKDDGSYRYGASNIYDVAISSGGLACTTTNISATEGSSTGCAMDSDDNFFKIDGFACTSRSASSPYTISFKKLGNVGITDGKAWVKFSTNCTTQNVQVPGCPEATDNGCSMSQGFYFAKPNVE
ncbi:hypothetical protein [Hymenobacter sp. B1770]|uniref:hypothetical protein n=1 Tax=Hymenobacter sp. B1770 TaxID=1718788 RepID=UPI003CF52813